MGNDSSWASHRNTSCLLNEGAATDSSASTWQLGQRRAAELPTGSILNFVVMTYPMGRVISKCCHFATCRCVAIDSGCKFFAHGVRQWLRTSLVEPVKPGRTRLLSNHRTGSNCERCTAQEFGNRSGVWCRGQLAQCLPAIGVGLPPFYNATNKHENKEDADAQNDIPPWRPWPPRYLRRKSEIVQKVETGRCLIHVRKWSQRPG